MGIELPFGIFRLKQMRNNYQEINDFSLVHYEPPFWVKDFNPNTFINANDFVTIDELVEYIIKIDNNDELYASYFKETIFSNKWLETFNDINKTFYKNLADRIIGKDTNLLNVKTCVSVNNNKEKLVVYGPEYTYTLIKEYINNLNLRYCVKYVTNVKEIETINPSKILFINNVHDNSVFNIFKNIEISILNIDSLYIPNFFNNIFEMISLYPNIKIYDYSLKNIEVLQKYNIRTEFLEYIYHEKEINSLKEINNQAKTYDFGIICYYKDVRCSYRRKHIVELLRSKGYTVNVACGFDRERDIDLGKCKIILNIHSKSFDIECRTFEHLRCNRLLYAGFKILSEVSYIDDDFILKYKENIKFIKYDDFENITRENIDKFNFISKINNEYNCKKEIGIFNIWHNKLFDKCYDKLDDYSLQKITMYDVNQKYSKVFNKDKNYNIVSEYKLDHYNSLYQDTNYCQTSCLYHVFKNKLYTNTNYIGFIQYDMELASDFIYDIEKKINQSESDTYFYSLTVANKVEASYICKPYDNSILEKYNNYFNTSHSYNSIKSHDKAAKFICLHTFVIPTKTFIKMMNWFCTITDWLHRNYINGLYSESMSKLTEDIFGLFLLLQIIENDNIQFEELKLHHEWPNLHNNTNFINYKDPVHYFSLDKIVDNRFTDKNTTHSYLETYEKLLKDKHLSCKNVLEIGIQRGGSIKLWNDYFINATIYGLDITDPPNFLNEYPRINTFKKNAYTIDSVNYFIEKDIKFDFILDDGPYTLESMIFTLIHYSKLLTPTGILIIEDIPSMDWAYLFERITNKYKENTHIYDLRENKGRYDDIVFTFTNSNIENIEFIDYKIEFGLDDNKIDITHTVISHSLNKEFIEIPTNDVFRAELYGDPCWGVVKSIYITTKDGSVTKCKDNYPIILDWQGILIKKPNFKYKLSACLLIKNETENLNDWIEHYINEGVEHFFITSNNSTDGIENFILNSEYKNIITLITDNSDINIYNEQVKHREILCKNFYNIIKNSTEWCILVDIDEFMYGKNGYTLSSFIDTLDEDIGCFYVYWNIFKPTLDSENNISDKFSLKKSCKRINLDLISDLSYEIKFVSKFGKSIFRTSMLQDHTQLWIHKVPTSGKIITNYGNISDYKYDNADDIYWSESNYTKVNICLNHYAIRNKKDYDNKSSQLENTHRYPFVKGLLDICELDNNYIIEDINILNL
jgi:hypothetical protein